MNSPSSWATMPVPAFADVAVERERLVLRQDVDPAQVGVDAVGERDVDDAVLAAKRNGRLGAIARQRKQPLTCATGQQYAESVFHLLHNSESRSRSANFTVSEGKETAISPRKGQFYLSASFPLA